jgi:hypothetical protein
MTGLLLAMLCAALISMAWGAVTVLWEFNRRRD